MTILHFIILIALTAVVLAYRVAQRRSYRNGWRDCDTRLELFSAEYCRLVAELRRKRCKHYTRGWKNRLETQLNNEETNGL